MCDGLGHNELCEIAALLDDGGGEDFLDYVNARIVALETEAGITDTKDSFFGCAPDVPDEAGIVYPREECKTCSSRIKCRENEQEC